MNLSSLSSQISLTLGNLIVLAIVILLLLISLVFFIIRLNKKLNSLKETKYGFGGKSIYSALGVIFLAAAIPMTVILVSNSTDIRRQASPISDIVITINKVQSTSDLIYGFTATPIYEDKPLEGTYNLNWTITGANDSVQKLEKNKSSDIPSYFEAELQPGTYKIKVVITTKEGSEFIKEKNLVVD